MTDNLVKRANFFFWMSPNHSTLRLLTPTIQHEECPVNDAASCTKISGKRNARLEFFMVIGDKVSETRFSYVHD